MKLVKLSEKVFVNPDDIEAIELGKGANSALSSVYMISGKAFTTGRNPLELMRDIEYAQSNKYAEHFAG